MLLAAFIPQIMALRTEVIAAFPCAPWPVFLAGFFAGVF
jgi:hypothetical protein